MAIQDFDLELNIRCSWDHLTLEQHSKSTRFCGYLEKLSAYDVQNGCSPKYITTVDDNTRSPECLLHTQTQVNIETSQIFRLKFYSDNYVPKRGFNISLSPVDDVVTRSENIKSSPTPNPSSVSSPASSSYQNLTTSDPTTNASASSHSTSTKINVLLTSNIMPQQTTNSASESQSTESDFTSSETQKPSSHLEQTTTRSSVHNSSATATVSPPNVGVSPTPQTASMSPKPPSMSPAESSSTASVAQSTFKPAEDLQNVTSSSQQPESACSGEGNPLILTDNSGYIESPGYKVDPIYPPNSHCKWRINNDKKQVSVGPCHLATLQM